MKKEIEKRVAALCNEAGTKAAAEAQAGIAARLCGEYDQLMDNGADEITAYREILEKLDKVREEIDRLPRTEEEAKAEGKRRRYRSLGTLMLEISFIIWALALTSYFYISFRYGYWHLTWLLFLWALCGQTILEMISKYNKGRPVPQILRIGLTVLLWLIVLITYFLVSFFTGAWHLTWIIFIVGGLIQTAILALL